jgi:hypothetical protein
MRSLSLSISTCDLLQLPHNLKLRPYADFTPSRGSTPIHQPRAQTVMSNIFEPDTHSSKSPEPSPTGRRKLAELLQEAMQNGPEESTDQELQLRSVAADGKPVSESTSSSACSSVPTPIAVANAKSRKEKAWYTGRCCLTSFVHSLTLDESERAQKMSSRPCAVWQWGSSALTAHALSYTVKEKY